MRSHATKIIAALRRNHNYLFLSPDRTGLAETH